MVVVEIVGGLGNQMFQYSVARALSLVKGESLFLDISAFERYRLHRFELTRIFDCHADVADHAAVREILGWQAPRSVRTFLLRLDVPWLRCSRWVVEPSFDYWPGIFDVPDTCYLSGYWQSEKYFYHIERVIRDDFIFKEPLQGRNSELAAKIADCNAVSLHVRRGDYVAVSETKKTHGVCSLEYYHAAVEYIAERVPSPEFFVFSDDISWVKDNLDLPFPAMFVDHNCGEDNYRDMQLMSLCRHHIIANSSFSWWGAWLNAYREKIVIAPRRWFADGRTTPDLIPSNWIVL